MLHISIKPEVIFTFYGLPVTNSMIASIVLTVLFLLFGIYFSGAVGRSKSKLVFFVRFAIGKLYDLFKPVTKEKSRELFPLLASFFFFILLSNWLGLLPGVGSIVIRREVPVSEETIDEPESAATRIVSTPIIRGATADLNTTIALGLFAFVAIQLLGFKYLGWQYLKKFISVAIPIAFFTGILELISEFSKIVSFAFRLFCNIFVGEVLIAVIAFLIPVLSSFPFLMLEVFVGFIQALVFSMLTAVFISSATAEHHA